MGMATTEFSLDPWESRGNGNRNTGLEWEYRIREREYNNGNGNEFPKLNVIQLLFAQISCDVSAPLQYASGLIADAVITLCHNLTQETDAVTV